MSTATRQPAIYCLNYGQDPLHVLAVHLIRTHSSALPDLSGITVLLPQRTAAVRLRRLLLEQAQTLGHEALLGPEITTLREWIGRQALTGTCVISRQAAELMLVQDLCAHPALYGHGNPWTLADGLLELFDAMTLYQVKLPASPADFERALRAAYGVADTSLTALGREAKLVHTLWHAWHEQLRARGLVDEESAYLLKLSTHLAAPPVGNPVYLVNDHHPAPAEQAWANELQQRGQLTQFLIGPPEAETTPYAIASGWTPDYINFSLFEPGLLTSWLNTVYNRQGEPLMTRARYSISQYPVSPAQKRLQLYAAGNAEDEASAIDIQIRQWLWQGKRNIGVITENRRLARRLRALLERAGIVPDDAAGWALSTTSAAAVLARWLECIEEDFPYQPLLDLLRSPFLAHGPQRDPQLEASYRLEQDIIRNENITRGLERYRLHISYRQKRLPDEMAAQYIPLLQLLDKLRGAASPLQQLQRRKKHPAADWINGLLESLTRLGLYDSLNVDAAGSRLLQELENMAAAGRVAGYRMTWSEFRTWLGRTLERFNFQPPSAHSPVRLMNLAQSGAAHFDALVIAGTERDALPGSGTVSPFFNISVRMRLGLPDDRQRLAQRFRLFRALLEAAPAVLITRRHEDQGECIVPSPWAAQLSAFHELAYGYGLEDHQLAALVRNPRTRIIARHSPQPPVQVANPATAVPRHLLPHTLSAHAYQSLMDCPYQFFAARCLQLAPPDAVREALQKSDFGERVHRCLEAFHTRISGLPEPFSLPLIEANRDQAITCMEAIAGAVFARDLEDNFAHRGWFKAWMRTIPSYIDWEIEHARQWRVRAVEQEMHKTDFAPDLNLRGRLDRLDFNQDQLGIIDYKTGRVPDLDQVIAGEAVQLPFYALLLDDTESKHITQVAYLLLEHQTVKLKTTLDGNVMHVLKETIGERLQTLVMEMHNGQALTAWGDAQTCAYCQMDGICRKQIWELEHAKA